MTIYLLYYWILEYLWSIRKLLGIMEFSETTAGKVNI